MLIKYGVLPTDDQKKADQVDQVDQVEKSIPDELSYSEPMSGSLSEPQPNQLNPTAEDRDQLRDPLSSSNSTDNDESDPIDSLKRYLDELQAQTRDLNDKNNSQEIAQKDQTDPVGDNEQPEEILGYSTYPRALGYDYPKTETDTDSADKMVTNTTDQREEANNSTTKIFGINGFGRIGRTALRAWWLFYRDKFELKLINTSGSMNLADWVHLVKYDSNYGPFQQEIEIFEQQTKDEVSDENPVLGTIKLDNHEIVVTAQRDPKKIPWGKYQVEVVLESTGAFTSREKAMQHLEGGAEKVIISAPSKGEGVSTSVIGVNQFDPSNQILSNASCTTNCVAPVTQVMVEKFGVEKAMLSTIHSYTDDQNTQDNSHKDLRRARSAAENIVPTSTGAAIATTQIIPELEGVFDGLAMRVPTSTGSLSDMVFLTKRATTVEEVNKALIEASENPRWQGILATTNDPIVSSDIIGRRESSIVDLDLTRVVGGNLVKIISWYDNEWGYCNRLLEQIART